jgi:hypothetical protein
MSEQPESQSPQTHLQELAKARLEQLNLWGQQWKRLQMVPEFKELVLKTFLGSLPELEQRVLQELELYGKDSKEFDDAKKQMDAIGVLYRHFKWLDEQCEKAAMYTDELKKIEEEKRKTDQGKEDVDGGRTEQ